MPAVGCHVPHAVTAPRQRATQQLPSRLYELLGLFICCCSSTLTWCQSEVQLCVKRTIRGCSPEHISPSRLSNSHNTTACSLEVCRGKLSVPFLRLEAMGCGFPKIRPRSSTGRPPSQRTNQPRSHTCRRRTHADLRNARRADHCRRGWLRTSARQDSIALSRPGKHIPS